MNSIPKTQNSNQQLERLAAQRELYSSAKRFYGLELLGSIAIPTATTVGSAIFPSIAFYSAIYGICFYLIDSLLIEPEIDKRKAKATKIQELFDCDVFELQKSEFRTVSDVTVEDVLNSYDAHKKVESNIERVKNWYPPIVGHLDISIGRLICQRLNYCWDARLRRSFATVLKVINLAIILFVLVAFSVGRLDGSYLPLALTSLLPLFRFSIKHFKDNQESSDKLVGLNKYFESLWPKILQGTFTKDELTVYARRIQDEIYDSRIKNPLIPDFFFWFCRDRDESLMSRTAKTLVEEYKEKAISRSTV